MRNTNIFLQRQRGVVDTPTHEASPAHLPRELTPSAPHRITSPGWRRVRDVTGVSSSSPLGRPTSLTPHFRDASPLAKFPAATCPPDQGSLQLFTGPTSVESHGARPWPRGRGSAADTRDGIAGPAWRWVDWIACRVNRRPRTRGSSDLVPRGVPTATGPRTRAAHGATRTPCG
jgi:hypothetical protein